MNLITITFDPAMWQLVPKELTAEMDAAGYSEFDDDSEGLSCPRASVRNRAYIAQIAAAPAHQQAGSDEKTQMLCDKLRGAAVLLRKHQYMFIALDLENTCAELNNPCNTDLSEANLNELTRMAQETGQYDQPVVERQQAAMDEHGDVALDALILEVEQYIKNNCAQFPAMQEKPEIWMMQRVLGQLNLHKERAQSTRAESLLRRALQQLGQWQKKYGHYNPEWLPPAGDVKFAEDVDAFLGARASLGHELTGVGE